MEIKNLFNTEYVLLKRVIRLIFILKFDDVLANKKLEYLSILYWNYLTGVPHLSTKSLQRFQSKVKKEIEMSDISNYINILKKDGLIKYMKRDKNIIFPKQLTDNISFTEGNLSFNASIKFKTKEKTVREGTFS